MQRQPLQQVIDTEDAIRRKIVEERNKTDEWLNAVKLRCEQEKEVERKHLEESFTQAVEEARRRRRTAADRLLADTEQKARSLQDLDEDMLRQILQRHLGTLLPGRSEEEDG